MSVVRGAVETDSDASKSIVSPSRKYYLRANSAMATYSIPIIGYTYFRINVI